MPALTKYTHKRIIRTFLLLLICTIILSRPTSADPGIPDTVMLESVSINMGDPAMMELWTVTDEWLTALEITLAWDWSRLVADSFVFAPGRTPTSIRGSVPDSSSVTIFVYATGTELISPGRLQLGTIFFSYPDTSDELSITIDTTTLYLSDSLVIRANTFTDTIWAGPFIPQFQSAELLLLVCCDGFTGNTNCDLDDNVDLADITRLIDRVYISHEPLCCEAEGNVNGDLLKRLDLADITALIDNVYITKEPTTPCF